MLQELADKVAELRERKDALSAELKEINETLDDAEKDLIAEMVAEDMPKFMRNGRTFYLSVNLRASIKADRKEDCFAWLKANGYAALVQESVNVRTLASFVKELTEDGGKPLPDILGNMLSVYEESKVNIRKGRA